MAYVAALLLIIYTLGIVYILNYGFKSYSYTYTPFILINAKNKNSIEYTIRKAMKKYPDREIYVVNKEQSEEMKEILSRFDRNFNHIHIIN